MSADVQRYMLFPMTEIYLRLVGGMQQICMQCDDAVWSKISLAKSGHNISMNRSANALLQRLKAQPGWYCDKREGVIVVTIVLPLNSSSELAK